MLNTQAIDEMTRAILRKLPHGIQEMQQDLEKHLHAALQSVLAKMDLVNREEFEVQSAVLLRTREKLNALEAKITELEQQINTSGG